MRAPGGLQYSAVGHAADSSQNAPLAILPSQLPEKNSQTKPAWQSPARTH